MISIELTEHASEPSQSESLLGGDRDKTHSGATLLRALVFATLIGFAVVTLVAIRERSVSPKMQSFLKAREAQTGLPAGCRRGKNKEFDPGCGEARDFFEGDVDTPEAQVDLAYARKPIKADAAARAATKHWVRGEVVYKFADGLQLDKQERIRWAMNHIRANIPGVSFRLRTFEPDYVNMIDNGNGGCSSAIGFQGNGAQKIRISNWCSKGSVAHEIVHTLGFWHEQSRPDRKNFVDPNLDNVKEGKQNNFQLLTANQVNSRGYGYDYGSIMHYGRTFFAINPSQDTLTPTVNGAVIGQRKHLSALDVGQLNAIYSSYLYEIQLTTCDVPNGESPDNSVRIGLFLKNLPQNEAIFTAVWLKPPARGKSQRYPIIVKSAPKVFQVKVIGTADAWCTTRVAVRDFRDDGTTRVWLEGNNKWWFDTSCSPSQTPVCTTEKIFSMVYCYSLTIRTCARQWAQSSSAVIIDLYGDLSQTPVTFTFGTSPGQGQTLVQKLCSTLNRGNVNKLTVRWSSSDAWCTDHISAKNEQTGNRLRFVKGGNDFVWFDTPQSAALAGFTVFTGDHTFDARYRYRLTVRTCNRVFAGTGAKIWFSLWGGSGNTQSVKMVPASRNQVQNLHFNRPYLGRIVSVSITMFSSNGWCLSAMSVYDYQVQRTTDFTHQLGGGTWFDKPCSGNYPPANLCYGATKIDTTTRYRLHLRTCAAPAQVTKETVQIRIVGQKSSYLVRAVPPKRGEMELLSFVTQNPLGPIESLVIRASKSGPWRSCGVKVENMRTNVIKDFTSVVGVYFDSGCRASFCVPAKIFFS